MKICRHIFVVVALTFVSSIQAQAELKLTDKKVDFGFSKDSKRNIDVIVVHSTFNASGGDLYDPDLVIKQFSQYRVSSHYLIGRDGAIYQLVNEGDIAYHAGKSSLPNGRTGLNTSSIGIELINSKDDTPSDLQISSLVTLVNNIKSRYKINYIVRHSDIAPGRKTDPWNMDWEGFLNLLKK